MAATVPFDDRYQQTAGVDDLSPRLIQDFLSEIDSELAHDAETTAIDELGRQMNIIGAPKESAFPKNVGLLFFHPQPDTFFPQAQIDIVWFPDGAGGDRFEEKIFRGPLGRMTRDALSYIERRYLVETVLKHDDRPEAERFWNFPRAAIEEAVVNAVYHRSYEIREPIEIRIDRDELSVLSFPGPDRSISLADLQRGKAISRRYRNRRIGEFLKELELCEGRSTGLAKILRSMASNGSPLPEFATDEDRSYFLIRLPIHQRAQRTQEITEDTPHVQDLLSVLQGEMSRNELISALALKDRMHFSAHYLYPALETELIEMSLPDTPRSKHQRYRLTTRGQQYRAPNDRQKTIGITQSTPHDTPHVQELLTALLGEMSRTELMDVLTLKDRMHFSTYYLQPALEAKLLEMTLPDTPRSKNQRYRLTVLGTQLRQQESPGNE